MADIQLIFSFLMDCLRGIWNVYTGCFILAAVIAIWLFRKVINYFKYVTG